MPASINGTYKKSSQQCQNALKLVDELGPAHFFITLTCNPDWPEIQRHLLPGQTAFDRPDITCRVFKVGGGEWTARP